MADTHTHIPSWLRNELDGAQIPNLTAICGTDGADSRFVHPDSGFLLNSDGETDDDLVLKTQPSPPDLPDVFGADNRDLFRHRQIRKTFVKPLCTPLSNQSKTAASSTRQPRATTRMNRSIAPKQRFEMTQGMRRTLMEVVLDCHRQNLLLIDKPSALKPAFEEIASRMSTIFPQYQWTEEQVQRKFRDEEMRWRQWLTATSSGDNVDENGLLKTSPEHLENLIANYPTVSWIKSEPLGNVEIYREVFINESGDEGDVLKELQSSEKASQDVIEIEDDIAGDEDEAFDETSTQLSIESSAQGSVKRRKIYDPDQLQDSSSDESLMTSIEVSLNRISRKKGSEDVARAVKLILNGVGKKMSPTERVRACFKVAEDMNAVIYCELEDPEDQWQFFISLGVVNSLNVDFGSQ